MTDQHDEWKLFSSFLFFLSLYLSLYLHLSWADFMSKTTYSSHFAVHFHTVVSTETKTVRVLQNPQRDVMSMPELCKTSSSLPGAREFRTTIQQTGTVRVCVHGANFPSISIHARTIHTRKIGQPIQRHRTEVAIPLS